ncbi:zinc finger-containing ubiquitin peptidase 1-like [Ylistrum balloti]|uniref:zinc finger-containing ubiquitin peptidase 1-like n=1 Tax=Ylistrum balloti TaxID=509963 RepID=UPI002905C72B|nr:zinc finger-containing ubiquitin peptidase 1-like [Ylistrum balloti]
MAEGGGEKMDLDDDAQFTCLICGQAGMTEVDMRSHIMMDHVDQDVCCPFCDLSGITPNEMNLHVNKVHLEEYKSPSKEYRPMDTSPSTSGDEKAETESPEKEIPIPRSPKSKDSGSLLMASPIKKNGAITNRSNRSNSLEDSGKRAKLNLDISSPVQIMLPRQSSGEGSLDTGVTASCIPPLARPDPQGIRASLQPRRAEMLLVPDINYNVEPDINSNVPMEFSCPLCQFSTPSEGDIQTHVNREHIDILSPCRPRDTQDDSKNQNGGSRYIMDSAKMLEYACPFCDLTLSSPDDLQIHVNSKHLDILSPDRVNSENGGRGSMSSSADMSDCVTCPVCDQEFNDLVVLEMHVNGHFSAEQTPAQEVNDQALAAELGKSEQEEKKREMREFQALQAMYGMASGTNYKKQYEKNLEKAVAKGDLSVTEFHLRKANLRGRDLNGVDDGHSCTKGIIRHLEEYYKTSTTSVVNFHLCNSVEHFCASYGDKGWGCGYRNFQMLLSAMAANPTYCKLLFNSNKAQIPSLPKIQRLIEAAWEKGFDKQGCEQLGGHVVDTTKWIGATEIAATLLSLKVRCQLLDFHNPSGPQGTHPKLFQWVKDYFCQPSPVKLPLYLQHQGHSRTIIGVEELKDGVIRLLIFDPSTSKKQMQLFNGFINSNIMRIVRRSIHGLKAKQYQIVAVTGILEDKAYEEHKVLKSERIS